MHQRISLTCFLLVVSAPSMTLAAASLVDEPEGDAYHFVTHYQMNINASVDEVWPWLVDLRSWMYEFELSSLSGEKGKPGEVLRLYEGQDFRIQILEVIVPELLVIANLPSEFQGEQSTGVGLIKLQAEGDVAVVDLVMSRRYVETGERAVAQKTTRQSEEFRQKTSAMWQDRFLGRLRCLAERNCAELGADAQ